MPNKIDGPQTSVIAFSLLGRNIPISRFTFLLIMGAIVGGVTGGVVVVFRLAALGGESLLFPSAAGMEQAGLKQLLFSSSALMRIVTPAIGGLLCGGLLYGIWRFEAGHSIPAILRAVASGQIFFKARMAVPPALAIITLATGGSAGPEGPVAEIGSVTGSNLGRWARIPPRFMKTLIGAGVAAGIAAVFNAPIAGIFFALEVILRNYEVASFTPIAVAAVVASVISQTALPPELTALDFPQMSIPLRELPLYALLGIICGLVSIGYIRGMGRCHDLFHNLPLPLWAKPAIGGLVVGLIGWVFPQVMGEGYESIKRVLNLKMDPATPTGLIPGLSGDPDHWIWLFLILIALTGLKILATGLTLGSGSPGGSFAPAVFIGAMGGAAFGVLMHQLQWAEATAGYAAMGIAGLISGALGAPITAIMITLRQGGHAPELLLPVLTTVALSMFIMQRSRNVSVYTLGLVRLGIDLDRARRADPLSLVKVETVMHEGGFEELPGSMPIFDAIARFKDSLARWFVVRGDAGAFLGIVSLHEMRMAIAEQELAHLLVLADITDPFLPRLSRDLNLKETLASFNASEAEVLPVFDGERADAAFVGVVSRQDALNAYWQYAEANQEPV